MVRGDSRSRRESFMRKFVALAGLCAMALGIGVGFASRAQALSCSCQGYIYCKNGYEVHCCPRCWQYCIQTDIPCSPGDP
jgi:hypothetical protein